MLCDVDLCVTFDLHLPIGAVVLVQARPTQHESNPIKNFKEDKL